MMTFPERLGKCKDRCIQFGLILLLAGIPLVASSLSGQTVADMELLSVGSGGYQLDKASFHVTTSEDGRYATFISFAQNIKPGDPEDDPWVDVFLRDRQEDVTERITYGYDGGFTDESSYDPIISADGRYVAYFSYATNLVPDDNNGHEWLRQGIDTFVYDTITKETHRVSLTSGWQEINGNSIGSITPDGKYAIFFTNGQVITPNNGRTAVYLRDWQSGEVERISKAMNGGYPDKSATSPASSYDGRYIVYISRASNLVSETTSGVANLFLYDRNTGDTKLITKAIGGGPANGDSNKAQVTYDGRYVSFLSHASNLVTGDTNAAADIFVFDRVTGRIKRISVADDGSQANGLSKDPSICADGRLVSYTTEATNLFPGDNNNQHDVIIHDLLTGFNIVASVNQAGEQANKKNHRSFLVPDCRSITLASDADNLVEGDTNNQRDVIWSKIAYPPDLSRSTVDYPAVVEPGEQLVYTYTLRNIGFETGELSFIGQIPTNILYLNGSATGGASYNSNENQVEWQGQLAGEDETTFSYAVTVDAGLIDPVVIGNQSVVSSNGRDWHLTGTTIVNGWQQYLPVVRVD